MHARDTDSFEKARRGDSQALEQLVESYLPQLHAFVRVRLGGRVRARESSMDIVQSACRELLADPSRQEFRGEERFRGWLFTTALNKLREKFRFHGRERRGPDREHDLDDDDLLPAASLLTPSVDAIGRETALALDAAMQALSEEHREVITMARIAQLPHEVIAELTQVAAITGVPIIPPILRAAALAVGPFPRLQRASSMRARGRWADR